MLKRRKSKKPKVASRGLNDSRTHALYRAGLSLLADKDFDEVSIAWIAKEAQCSVGAFYERFLTKDAYLIFLIRNSFRTQINRLENDLPKIATLESSRKSIIEEITKFLAEEFAGEKTAGVIRVALKLAPKNPEALTPITEYRAAASNIIGVILKPHIKSRNAQNRVAEALQIIFAIIFDAIQQNHGPLQLNNARMSAVLSRQFEARISDNSKLPRGVVFNSAKSGRNRTQNKVTAIEPEEIVIALRKKSRTSAPKATPQGRRKVKVI